MARTLRDIFNEVFSEGYFDRARRRAQRRKSSWNVVLFALVVGAVSGTTYILFQIMWQLHVAIYPSHMDRFSEFWAKNISFGSFVSSFLLLVPLFFAALPIGMIIANFVAWLIPAARGALDRESEGVVGASFAEATSDLWKIALVVVPICLVLSSIGAATLRDLR